MNLAIFDLDNTLIGGDSDHSWGVYLCEQGLVDTTEYERANDQFYADYQNGSLDIFRYLAFALSPLTQLSNEDLQRLRDDFMTTKIAPIMLPKASALLDQHRSAGDTLLIITATNSFITHPIAEALGVEHILATDAEIKNGQYTGRIAGTPCFQEGKVERLKAWLKGREESLLNSTFYSDSINDKPLFDVVDKPIAVDPCAKLRAHAEANHIPIISLR